MALWMAGALLHLPEAIPLERIVQVALEKEYTAQGEMFSGEEKGQLHRSASLESWRQDLETFPPTVILTTEAPPPV